ncbi:hypothetical protein M407DRAFT_26431 [Tulasnella calospora MUT 4182]|uniref:F-box domain-containing protein n=1 Tax=Tulasnella calospora MUT 4182 TaxID=1051891 RepID=A0A0C3LRW3_9AGAM|nr:hypothetical protein M407DRAFT_26431 [Tulasnella calospora MUT 4182]
MEVDIIQNEAAQDQVTAPWDANPLPSISQLPTELLTGIIQLSLPEIDFKLHSASFRLRSHMKRLYIMRSVTKRWQAIIEGTPSFWITIASALPSDVNEASVLRSSNLPLSIIYRDPRPGLSNDHLSATEFLKLVQHTRPRWSSLVLDLYDNTDMSNYLGVPLPLLQTIIVGNGGRTRFEPLELLGRDTSNLRFVELSGISIRWRMGLFVQLKCLKFGATAS